MILARHAEALFWAGRQLERSEHTTRALDVFSRAAMHNPPARANADWELLLDALGLSDLYHESHDTLDSAHVTEFLFADTNNPGSVAAAVHQLRENIRTVRDRIPVELWEEANRLYLELAQPHAMAPLHHEPVELFSSVRRGCQAMTGVVAEGMPRDEGYTFFVIGRMVERSILTCRVLRFALSQDPQYFDATTLLRMLTSLQAYRRLAGHDDDPVALAVFLLSADHVPRSVLSCLRRTESRLEPLQAGAPGVSPARTVTGRLRSLIEFDDVEGALRLDSHGFLSRIEAELWTLAEAIAGHAFNPVHAPALHSQFVRPGAGSP